MLGKVIADVTVVSSKSSCLKKNNFHVKLIKKYPVTCHIYPRIGRTRGKLHLKLSAHFFGGENNTKVKGN